jgi:uncharacterized protein
MRTARRFKSALVTGATSGIGRAFAEVLPPSTSLLLTGRNETKLQQIKAQLTNPMREVTTVAADLTTDAGREAVIARAQEKGIDLLINNAGVGYLGRLINHPPEQERAMVELNVVAPLVLTRALLPGMLERAQAERRRAGLIIVASEAAFAPVPYFATYAASKAFDLGLAESLAEELANEPVDVLALCPGSTRSEFGTRAGFAAGNLPGASDPRAVAREALGALGRNRVLVSGLARRAAFAPLVLPRLLAAKGLGAVMDLVMRWQEQRAREEPVRRRSAPFSGRGPTP